jgi:hypothetical protein
MRKILLSVFALQALTLSVIGDDQRPKPGGEVAQLSRVRPKYLLVNNDSDTRSSTITDATDGTADLVAPHSNPVNVMPLVNATPIFWGVSWQYPSFYSDKIFGLLRFYDDFQNSSYADAIAEYLPAPLSIAVASPVIDTTPAGSDPNSVLAEVCANAGYVSDATTHFYPVYSDIPRGSASYCGYHAAGTCFGVPVQFAFFFNLDNDPGCDPISPYAPPKGSRLSQKPGSIAGVASMHTQSQGLAALANVSTHELVETITDPAYFSPSGGSEYWGGWYDSAGNEVEDKCEWTFGPSQTVGLSNGSVLIGGYYWKLQGVWSNNAEQAGLGYATQNDQLFGCTSGS